MLNSLIVEEIKMKSNLREVKNALLRNQSFMVVVVKLPAISLDFIHS